MTTDLLIALLCAHVLGDFVLQTRGFVEEKHRPAVLAGHGAIHGALSYVLVGRPGAWIIPVVIFMSHVLIDYAKSRFDRGDLKGFVADQLAHLGVIVAVAVAYAALVESEASIVERLAGAGYYRVLACIAGFVAAVRAGAYFVDLAVESFLTQIRMGDHTMRGLRNGGRMIGQLERALIFIFVLINQFSAIGFLIAAKSIFRFGELKDRANRMEAEYIIIGTLISFLWAIGIGLLTTTAL